VFTCQYFVRGKDRPQKQVAAINIANA